MSDPKVKPRVRFEQCYSLSLPKEIECISEHIDKLDREKLIKARDELNKLIGELTYRNLQKLKETK